MQEIHDVPELEEQSLQGETQGWQVVPTKYLKETQLTHWLLRGPVQSLHGELHF